ncbi:MAG TPA: ammonia-forming cytochrome c nitrite reductase subunit c552, partial [Gemmatimonadaceae bacterium]|nr:ammonia-forming cytochrome c nitrite reductase subunit c552 [Gemmatimonadaceae bacterium]
MLIASPASVRGNFNNATVDSGSGAAKFFRSGDRFLVNTEGADGKPHDFEIRYTFGVYPLQQYLVAFRDGKIQAMRYAWDSRTAAEGGQRWFSLDPGTRAAHTDEFHWTARQNMWNFMCADCHSTGLQKGYDPATDQFKSTWSEINVGCEACHGPASEHVTWAKRSSAAKLLWRDPRITNTLHDRVGVTWSIDRQTGNAHRSVAPSTTRREVETCAQCHSRRVPIADNYVAGKKFLDYYVPAVLIKGLYYPDGQQREEVYNYGSFLQSRMYHMGVTCSDCHEPHSATLRRPGNATCGQCHLQTRYDAPSHTLHPSGSVGAQCAACHMPTRTYMQIDPRQDHSIRIPRPDRTVSLGIPNACNNCHTDKTASWADSQIVARHGSTRKGFQRFVSAFAADDTAADDAAQQLAEIANDSTEPIIARASALARLVAHPGDVALSAARTSSRDPDALVRRSAVSILDALPPEQRAGVAAPLLVDESRAVRIEAARVLAAASASLTGKARNDFSRASAEFIASQRYLADRAENRDRLAMFFDETGHRSEAEAEYRAAIKIAPRYSPAYVNLADLLRRDGREADGETILRQGVAAIPNDATLRFALGLALVRSRKMLDALGELERATKLAPDQPRFAYVYAVALSEAGQRDRALAITKKLL